MDIARMMETTRSSLSVIDRGLERCGGTLPAIALQSDDS